MKALVIALFFATTIPSVTSANFCRASSDDLASREQCLKDNEMNGVYFAGDWSIIDSGDTSLGLQASNFPLHYSGKLSNLKVTRKVKAFCFNGKIPFIEIYTGEMIGDNPSIAYSFDGDSYTEFENYRVNHNTIISIFGWDDFAKNLLTRSLLSIRMNTQGGESIEYTYTLSGGAGLKEKLSCFNSAD